VVKDSLVNLENLNKSSALKEGYEAEKREQQIALLNKEKEILNKDKALKESELERRNIDLARSQAEQNLQQQSILLLNNEKELLNKEKVLLGKEKDLRALTVSRQEAELTAAHARDEQNKQALALATSEQERQRAELQRRSVVQWSLAGFLVLVAASALWLWRLNRQKLRAYKKVSKQQKILEDQAAEIQQANMELHQQNEELTALNIEKNELMGIVSHDLKNPIGAVRGYAELIENQTFTGDEVLSASSHIVQVSERMLELVKNLLDMNQMESGGLQLNMVNFDISPVVEAVVDQYRTPAEAKQITLHFSNETEESTVSADEQALMQVLDNLVSNAVKYSPHGKQAFVRILRNEAAVRIEVQDQGEGISEEDMKKLFGKFARLSARPTGGEHSTGLGLSIVKRMVEAMNGKVWCESELGKGSMFIVELPSSHNGIS
jgi:signal transduction histidine kinase